jgi:zinc transporter 1/2/3
MKVEKSSLKAYIIEASIAVHSILIGIALGVGTEEPEITSLLIALCFHQFFEGIALGGAVAKAQQSRGFLVTLIGLFSVSCSLGVAIGIGITEYFDESNPEVGWITGIFGSLAAGTLLYIGLCDLMADSFHDAIPGLRKFWCVGCVLFGLGIMALIAVWA